VVGLSGSARRTLPITWLPIRIDYDGLGAEVTARGSHEPPDASQLLQSHHLVGTKP